MHDNEPVTTSQKCPNCGAKMIKQKYAVGVWFYSCYHCEHEDGFRKR